MNHVHLQLFNCFTTTHFPCLITCFLPLHWSTLILYRRSSKAVIFTTMEAFPPHVSGNLRSSSTWPHKVFFLFEFFLKVAFFLGEAVFFFLFYRFWRLLWLTELLKKIWLPRQIWVKAAWCSELLIVSLAGHQKAPPTRFSVGSAFSLLTQGDFSGPSITFLTQFWFRHTSTHPSSSF